MPGSRHRPEQHALPVHVETGDPLGDTTSRVHRERTAAGQEGGLAGSPSPVFPAGGSGFGLGLLQAGKRGEAFRTGGSWLPASAAPCTMWATPLLCPHIPDRSRQWLPQGTLHHSLVTQVPCEGSAQRLRAWAVGSPPR